MTQYRDGLPQLLGDLYLTDAGLETDLIACCGSDIRHVARIAEAFRTEA